MKKKKIDGYKKQKIFKTIKQYKSEIEKKGYEVLFIGLKGSQNYNLDYEGSDIDCMCAVKPHKYGTSPISFKMNMSDNNENTVTVQDIFTFTQQVNKGNCSYIEVLNSPFKINKLPAMYSEAKGSVKSHYHMMMQKYKALSHPYPSKIGVIEKYGYDPKQLHHIYRLHYLVLDAYEGKDPREVWVEDGAVNDFLMTLKTDPLLIFESLEDVTREVEDIMETTLKMMNEKPDVFNVKVDNGISDDYIVEYLESLDYKDNAVKQAELVDKVYNILNNTQFLEKSLKIVKNELYKVYDIDIRRIETKVFNKKANEPTRNFEKLHEVYTDFLNLLHFVNSEHNEDEVEQIAKERGMSVTYAQTLQDRFQLHYMTEELYTNTLKSKLFIDFTNKYHDILKETPGFYQKYNISHDMWTWKFVFSPGIIIPNQVNGQIRNLQVRGNKEGASKYFNFSSSKKTGEFYKYATKAHQGITLLENDNNDNDTLIITEGFFKAVTISESKDTLNQLLAKQDIPSIENYKVLSLPGLSANMSDIDFTTYEKILFAFDRDCHLGDNNQAQRQYSNMLKNIKNKSNNNCCFYEYIPYLKVDDDILDYNKKN